MTWKKKSQRILIELINHLKWKKNLNNPTIRIKIELIIKNKNQEYLLLCIILISLPSNLS